MAFYAKFLLACSYSNFPDELMGFSIQIEVRKQAVWCLQTKNRIFNSVHTIYITRHHCKLIWNPMQIFGY